MKIVADENIPLVKKFFSSATDLVLKPGRDITQADLVEADCLLVRSVTKVDESLLAGTAVRFIGSSATGLDHIDTAWLDKVGIKWFAAEGCNTQSVVEYVITVVAALNKQNIFPSRQLKAGVIGVGKIGSLVAKVLEVLGFEVVVCDPPRAEQDPAFSSTSLSEFANLDFITLHVPLVIEGKFPTFHMIDKEFLLRQQKGAVLLNTSRGAVIDFSDLEEYGGHLYWCLDVWENEPYINFEILNLAEIATPHIAGYSLQSKQRGIEMVYQAALKMHLISEIPSSLEAQDFKTLSFSCKQVDWQDVILQIYDPYHTTQIMKQALIEDGSGKAFDLLRKHFNDRYEFSHIRVTDLVLSEQDKIILQNIGIREIDGYKENQ